MDLFLPDNWPIWIGSKRFPFIIYTQEIFAVLRWLKIGFLCVILYKHSLNGHKFTRYHKIDHVCLGYNFIILYVRFSIEADVWWIDGTEYLGLWSKLFISYYLVPDVFLAIQRINYPVNGTSRQGWKEGNVKHEGADPLSLLWFNLEEAPIVIIFWDHSKERFLFGLDRRLSETSFVDQSKFAKAFSCLQGRNLFVDRVIMSNINFIFRVPQIHNFGLMLACFIFQLLCHIC